MDLLINRKRVRTEVDADRPLLFVLRNQLGLTGTKYGCGEGQCGACTVLVDGKPQRSCQIPAGTVGGKDILTIEGLADDGQLHPVQRSFIECDAMQCGYCTPGMILSSVALLHKNASPPVAEIKRALEGNVCRCGTYNRIIAAVNLAARSMAEEQKEKRNA